MENAVRRGQQVCRTATELRAQGFSPDLICVHPGWGEGLYLRDIFPKSRILSYLEAYYHGDDGDACFDAEFQTLSLDVKARIRTHNAHLLLAMEASDWGISPTHWQCSLLPRQFHHCVSVIHDGIDTQRVKPDPDACIMLQRGGLRLTVKDEVITYVARNLEPYRGFHIFMRALPRLRGAARSLRDARGRGARVRGL